MEDFSEFEVNAIEVSVCLQIRPLEEMYKFGAFFSSYLNESDFYAKPSVLLLGQYSTGPAPSQHNLASNKHKIAVCALITRELRKEIWALCERRDTFLWQAHSAETKPHADSRDYQ